MSDFEFITDEDLDVATRSAWPFKSMDVGQIIAFDKDKDPEKAAIAQRYCHVYGKKSNKRFSTTSIKKDGRNLVAIKRTK